MRRAVYVEHVPNLGARTFIMSSGTSMFGQDTSQSAGQPKSEQEKELKARKLVDLVGRKRFHSE